MKLVTALCTLVVLVSAQDDFLYGTFPDGFQWGAATSAYQIEGAWNLNGKSFNNLNDFTH
jgi:lactase-phlorizin hydrolase